MSKRKLVVPEARAALDQFKAEIAKEFGIHDNSTNYLASFHTGRITKNLVEKGERELLDK